ncbi:EndoU domain-containing protein [Halotia wernerae UHCC 0503]|nr:EndoU domain-containing protein [Halotia wernerae UHCC 0503]
MPKFTLPLKIAGGAVFLLSFFAFRAISATISEGFESGQKGAYAAADINLSTGTWNLSDALIGNLSSDVKNGSQSVRIRNNGKVTMKFDRTTGAGTVTIKHAKYGNDASTTWGLWCSTNSGTSWTPVSSIKGYAYTLSAEEILAIPALAYKNNPNTSSTNTVCHWSVTDEGRTFKAVFVRRSGGIRTFYPDATPGSNPNCVQ